MNTVLAAVLALGAAALYAVASTLQQFEAGRTARGAAVSLRGLAGLPRRPLWLLGGAADVAGVGLQVAALSFGPVVLVQPLQVLGLLFALPLAALLRRRRPAAGQVVAGVGVVAGVAVFLQVAGVRAQGNAPGTTATAVLSAGTLGALVVGALAVRRMAPAGRSAVLGACAGAGFAVASVLVAALGRRWDARGLHALAGAAGLLTLTGLVTVGLLATVLSQAAFQVGSLAQALPTLTVVDPVVSVLLAAGLLGERVRLGAVPVVGYVSATVVVVAAVVRLARPDGVVVASAATAAPAGAATGAKP